MSGVDYRTVVSSSASNNIQRDKIEARCICGGLCVDLGSSCERYNPISSEVRQRRETLRVEKAARCKQRVAMDGFHSTVPNTIYHNGGFVCSYLLYHEEVTTVIL